LNSEVGLLADHPYLIGKLMGKIKNQDWIVIGTYNGNINAEMAKNILLKNDIPSYIKSDFFGSAYNLNAFNIPTGMVKLYIPEGFKKKALDLLQGIGLQNE